MKKQIEKGQWGENLSWTLYSSDELPDKKLITAVFCVAIKDKQIILMRGERGWGMLGGHIEQGETILDALIRESKEEGGFTPNNPQLFGYREITAKEPAQGQDNDTTYPFPTSYIAYYIAMTTKEVVLPTGSEVLGSKAFSLDEIRSLNISDFSTVELGWQFYLKH